MTKTTVKTKEEDDSKENATTVAKKARKVPTAGRRNKIPTNDRLSIAKEKGKREFLLMTKNKGLTFAANDSLLADPNIWIADSSATSDTTAYEIGMTNTKIASDKDNITDASGNNVSGKTVGDLKGVTCNKQGKELHDATIKELVYVPGSTFNLFSLSKRLENE